MKLRKTYISYMIYINNLLVQANIKKDVEIFESSDQLLTELRVIPGVRWWQRFNDRPSAKISTA